VNSRQKLLDALGRLLEHQGLDVTLPELAREAGVSSATAYRHFDDVEEVRAEFYNRIFDRVIRAIEELTERYTGLDLFHRVCQTWVELELPWARAATYIRSAEGILERVQRGEGLSSSYHRLVTGVLDQLIAAGVIPAQDTDYAALLWLTIFDERVFVDLHTAKGMESYEISHRLGTSLLAVLKQGDHYLA
jgi:AcrR family transcriptional regulator